LGCGHLRRRTGRSDRSAEQTEEPELLNSKLYLPVVGRKGLKKTVEGMSDSDIAALNVRWGVELAQ
jgi:hypothetical protein